MGPRAPVPRACRPCLARLWRRSLGARTHCWAQKAPGASPLARRSLPPGLPSGAPHSGTAPLSQVTSAQVLRPPSPHHCLRFSEMAQGAREGHLGVRGSGGSCERLGDPEAVPDPPHPPRPSPKPPTVPGFHLEPTAWFWPVRSGTLLGPAALPGVQSEPSSPTPAAWHWTKSSCQSPHLLPHLPGRPRLHRSQQEAPEGRPWVGRNSVARGALRGPRPRGHSRRPRG